MMAAASEKSPGTARRGSALLVAAAVLFGVALVATGIATRRAVADASATLIRGQADLLHDELRLSVARSTQSPVDLPALLAAFSDEGLSYLAIVDERGEVLAETGLSDWAAGIGREFQGPSGFSIDRHGDRVRASYRRGRRGRAAQRLGIAATTRLVFEFTPQEAMELERRTGWGVLLAALAASFAVLLALAHRAQQRRADLALRAEEQSRRLASLGQMSAVMAHELRNPLASLKGHAQLLERALPDGGVLRSKAELVVSEAVRLERLSSDLLSFARTGELHREVTDVAALVRAVCDGRERTDLLAPTPVQASIDPDRLRQVIANLVDNALQADEGRVQIAVAARDDEFTITVRDHGPGIAHADLPRLFEPFFTTKTHGTGLGLAVARYIVGLHGGTIAADNVEGGGARFVVTLSRKG